MSRLDSVYCHWVRVAELAAGDAERAARLGNRIGWRLANGQYRQACRRARQLGDVRRGALAS